MERRKIDFVKEACLHLLETTSICLCLCHHSRSCSNGSSRLHLCIHRLLKATTCETAMEAVCTCLSGPVRSFHPVPNPCATSDDSHVAISASLSPLFRFLTRSLLSLFSLSLSLSLSLCLPACLPTCLSVCLSVRPSVRPSVRLSLSRVCVSVCLSVSVCLCLCLSVSLSVSVCGRDNRRRLTARAEATQVRVMLRKRSNALYIYCALGASHSLGVH